MSRRMTPLSGQLRVLYRCYVYRLELQTSEYK